MKYDKNWKSYYFHTNPTNPTTFLLCKSFPLTHQWLRSCSETLRQFLRFGGFSVSIMRFTVQIPFQLQHTILLKFPPIVCQKLKDQYIIIYSDHVTQQSFKISSSQTLALNSARKSKCFLRSVARMASMTRKRKRLNSTWSRLTKKLNSGLDR